MGASVLVVDDHAGFRAAARVVLERDGYTVVAEAADRAGALDAARRAHPDVALIDVGLGADDGFEVTEALVALDAGLQVVLVSSRDRADLTRRLEASSARGFIAKDDLLPGALARMLSAS